MAKRIHFQRNNKLISTAPASVEVGNGL